MNIRFTSSLTPEDENRVAPALIKTVAGILDLLPIAYAIRIDTSDANVYQHIGASHEPAPDPKPLRSHSAGMVGAASHR
jgi:hypothetical protein